MMPRTVRVVVVEDFPLVRDGIAAALERDPLIAVVGTAADGIEGLRAAHELRPDVMLVDLHMPEAGGIMVLERLRAELPEILPIILTASEQGAPLLAAIAAGARGYLTKRSVAEELRQAVLTVKGGGSVIAPSLVGHLFQTCSQAARGEQPELRPVLTLTEQEVLRLLTEGLTDHQISQRLFISPRTVQNHLARIKDKLSLRRRSELVRWAVVHAMG